MRVEQLWCQQFFSKIHWNCSHRLLDCAKSLGVGGEELRCKGSFCSTRDPPWLQGQATGHAAFMRPQYSNLLSEISYPGTVPKNSVFCIHIPKNRYYYYSYYSTQYSYVCTYTYTLYNTYIYRERESIDTRINSAFLLDIRGIFGLPQKAPFLSHPIKHTKAHCRAHL